VYYLETGPRFLPSNVYFVSSGTSWALIDAGWGDCSQGITEAAGSLFGGSTRPAAILLTHVHPDHDGAALALSWLWEVPVFMHPAEMPLTAGTIAAVEAYPAGPLDRRVILPLMRRMPRHWEAMLAKASLKEKARPFDPSGPVPGLPDWECVPTPGHSPGHVSYF
jgi:glyoxylase-like metal-dependent hydrolase (beta-lactamase superfamily II)